MKSSMGKELKMEAGLKPVKKENTLKAKTDKVENVRSAMTPEAEADDWGVTALKKKKRGGKVEGDKPKARLDRRARGGKVASKGSRINIIVAPGAGGGPAGPMPPMGAGGPPMPPPTMVRPPMAPQGSAPPMMPPAGPSAPSSPGLSPPGMMRKDGGRVSYPLDAGSGGGEGRMEKVKAYGKNAKP